MLRLRWLARFTGLAQLVLYPLQHVLYADLVLFNQGLHTEEMNVAPGRPSLEQGFVLAARDYVGSPKAGSVFDSPARKSFGEMIRVALVLCETPGGRIRGALSIACNCERKDVIVGAVEFRGIEALGLEARMLGIDGVAFPDYPDEGAKARQS